MNRNDLDENGLFTDLQFTDGAAALDIRYVSSELEDFTLTGSGSGGNTYNINDTTATRLNRIIDGNGVSGDSTFNIAAQNVQAGAANEFNGNAGNDTFNLNFAGDASISAAAGTTFVVNGGPAAADRWAGRPHGDAAPALRRPQPARRRG